MNTPGPRTFVVVPPAVAVNVGTPDDAPAVIGARTTNPPMSLPRVDAGSDTSVTVPTVTPGTESASAEKVALSVGIHIAPMTTSPAATPTSPSNVILTLPALES